MSVLTKGANPRPDWQELCKRGKTSGVGCFWYEMCSVITNQPFKFVLTILQEVFTYIKPNHWSVDLMKREQEYSFVIKKLYSLFTTIGKPLKKNSV